VQQSQPSGRLRDTWRQTWRRFARELSAFGVVGAACFLLDVGLFQLLYSSAGLDAVTAKLVATLVSMTVAYGGHRYWSFAARARTGLRREYVRFALINGLTLLLGLAIVGGVRHPLHQESAVVLQLANIASIAIGTVVRYLSYRRWVFPAHSVPAVPLVDVV
jgi:putative flippase GtrA